MTGMDRIAPNGVSSLDKGSIQAQTGNGPDAGNIEAVETETIWPACGPTEGQEQSPLTDCAPSGQHRSLPVCPVALAISMARPVARGLLSLEGARSAIAIATDRAMTAGSLDGNGTLAERLHIDVHILNQHAANFRARMEQAEGAIRRVVRPLIDMHATRGRIMAEAFNANEDAGSPLSETEVSDITATAVYWSLPSGSQNVRR